MSGPPQSISPADSSRLPGYVCNQSKDDWVTFCAPANRFNFGRTSPYSRYYIITDIPPDDQISAFVASIRGRFGNRPGNILTPSSVPPEINVPVNKQILDVTELLPKIVPEKNGNAEKFIGPNCYWAALTTLGILKGKPRYVDGMEFSYFITLYTRIIPYEKSEEDRNTFGGLTVFLNPRYVQKLMASGSTIPPKDLQISEFCDTSKLIEDCEQTVGLHAMKTPKFNAIPEPSPIRYLKDYGNHAAVSLQGDILFHKQGYHANNIYQTMLHRLSMFYVDYMGWYNNDDKFGRGKAPEKSDYETREAYTFVTYRPNLEARVNETPLTGDETRMIALFDRYSGLLEEAAEINPTKFAEERLDLIFIDNVWATLQRFKKKYINNFPAKLLGLNPTLATAYLKLHSLSWQYFAMVDEYILSKEKPGHIGEHINNRKRAYTEHYIKSLASEETEGRFRAVVEWHMDELGIREDKKLRDGIYESVKAMVLSEAPRIIQAASEDKRIDLREKVVEAIKHI